MDEVLREFKEGVVSLCDERDGVSPVEIEQGVLPCTPLRFRWGTSERIFNWRNHERLGACLETLHRAGLGYVGQMNFIVFTEDGTLTNPVLVPKNYFYSFHKEDYIEE